MKLESIIISTPGHGFPKGMELKEIAIFTYNGSVTHSKGQFDVDVKGSIPEYAGKPQPIPDRYRGLEHYAHNGILILADNGKKLTTWSATEHKFVPAYKACQKDDPGCETCQ